MWKDNKLSGQIKEVQSELLNLKSTLEQYNQCGPEFSELVREYARLQKEIEGKKWALSELRGGASKH